MGERSQGWCLNIVARVGFILTITPDPRLEGRNSYFNRESESKLISRKVLPYRYYLFPGLSTMSAPPPIPSALAQVLMCYSNLDYCYNILTHCSFPRLLLTPKPVILHHHVVQVIFLKTNPIVLWSSTSPCLRPLPLHTKPKMHSLPCVWNTHPKLANSHISFETFSETTSCPNLPHS